MEIRELATGLGGPFAHVEQHASRGWFAVRQPGYCMFAEVPQVLQQKDLLVEINRNRLSNLRSTLVANSRTIPKSCLSPTCAWLILAGIFKSASEFLLMGPPLAPPPIASPGELSPSLAPRPIPTTAECPREVLCCVPGERFPDESLSGEAVGVKKTSRGACRG